MLGNSVKFAYNANDLVSSASLSKESVTTTTQFAYDGNGNLTAVTDPLGRVTQFTYDALKRLTNVTFDSPTPETPGGVGVKSRAITLDKLDNILKITDNENAMVTEIIGELEGKGKVLNQYSKFNDLPLEYDTNGNLSAKGSRLFAYDYRNRLIRSSRGDDAVTFTYDIFGRQTSRTDLSGTQRYFYAGDQKIEERNASGQVIKHYLWGNGIDELLRLDVYNGTIAKPYYVHSDNIGSTTAITDSSGNLVERVNYDVYGAPAFTDALGQTLKKSTIRNTTLFQGREYDYDLALYNYRARYFDPSLGRFLQTDPLGYQDSMNLYQGMGMNPVNYLDPMGKTGSAYGTQRLYSCMSAENLLRMSIFLRSAGKTTGKGLLITGGIAAVGAFSPAVAIASSGGLLFKGLTDSAVNRISNNQSMQEVIFGTAGDMTPLGNLYSGLTGKDFGTFDDLGLTPEEQADRLGTGVGQSISLRYSRRIANKGHEHASWVRDKIQPWVHDINAQNYGVERTASEDTMVYKVVANKEKMYDTISGHVTPIKPKTSWGASKDLQVNYRPYGYSSGKMKAGSLYKEYTVQPQFDPKGGGIPEYFINRHINSVPRTSFNYFLDYQIQILMSAFGAIGDDDK